MAAKTPYRIVLDDWSAGVKGASQEILFDSPQPDIVWDDAQLAAQTGPIPYRQSANVFSIGEGGRKFEIGMHLFTLPAKCNDEIEAPVYQILGIYTPSKDRWSGWPSMVGYDHTYDTTIPPAHRITVYNEDGSIHHIFQMYRDGLPLNDPSLGQTRNLTTRYRPFFNIAQMLYHCSHRLKMSSDARKYYAGTVGKYWNRPKMGRSRALNNPAIPAFGTKSMQVNGYGHLLYMPEWSLNTSDADWNSDPKTDTYINWTQGNSGSENGGSQYPTHALGWRYEPGAYVAGHEPRRGPGGQRFDRFPVPSQLTYLMTDPNGARMQGNVLWRTIWDNYAAGFFNIPYHHVSDAKTMAMLPFSEVAGGMWGHLNTYYNYEDNPSDPQYRINLRGLGNGEAWTAYHYDRDGRFPYSNFTSDPHHNYDVPAWHTTHFNSVAHAISQKLRYYAMIMSWVKSNASPGADPTAGGTENAHLFQRQHAWRWEHMAFLWKTSGNGPLVPRTEVEGIWKIHLEAMFDFAVDPATNPTHPKYNLPFFEGLRNLGMPVIEVQSGTDHYYSLLNDDKKFYFFGVVGIMRTLGCFDRLRQLSAKCAATLDFVVECFRKGASERMVATKGRQPYGLITPTVPLSTPLIMPLNWADVAATMQPQDSSDMARNADGTPFRGDESNGGRRDRWQYQHLMQQSCYIMKDVFSDYDNTAVNEAVAMSDSFEETAYQDTEAGFADYSLRFVAAGRMLTENIISEPGGDVVIPENQVVIGGPLGALPIGVSLIVATKNVTLTLRDKNGAALTGITNLKWAWFDQPNPANFTSPTAQGSAAAVDQNGQIVISIPLSALVQGQVGWLMVTDSDGEVTTLHKAFSGPATVSE